MAETQSQLLGLSFDALASPAIRAATEGAADGVGQGATLTGPAPAFASLLPDRWGLGCYVDDERAASVVNTGGAPQPALPGMAPSPVPWRSTLYLAQTPGRGSDCAPHPLRHGYAGRDFLFAVAGTLAPDIRAVLPLGDDFDLAPVSDSPDQHTLSWLIAQLRNSGARVIGEYGWSLLRECFARINEWGPASFLFSDGVDLVAYRDAHEQVPLHWGRRTPPHESSVLEGHELLVECEGHLDATRTLFVFSTVPMKGVRWTPMEPGELRVARRGMAVWSSHPSGIDEQVFARVPALGTPPEERQPIGEIPLPGVRRPRKPILPSRVGPKVEADRATLSILHETLYRYTTPVERSNHRFCLHVVRDEHQELLEQTVDVSVPGVQRDFEDVFGNRATVFDVTEPFTEMCITSRVTVRVDAVAVGDLRSPLRRDQIPLVWMPWQRQMMQAYLLPPELPEAELRELSDFAMSFVERNDYDLVETLLDLNRTIYRDFTYVPSSTTVETTPFQVYTQRRGVCQDFANVLICLARLLGVPARYRVGYIYTGGNYENRIQSDASHAWAELYLPWTGWCGFDPTNGCLTGADHVRVACGRQFNDAAPTSGTIFQGGGGEQLSVRVEVDRLND